MFGRGIPPPATAGCAGGYHTMPAAVGPAALGSVLPYRSYHPSDAPCLLYTSFEGDGFYQLEDVPHGYVTRHYYPSEVTGRTESCLVYCPPDSEGKALPILYLQHGLGENETGWVHPVSYTHLEP